MVERVTRKSKRQPAKRPRTARSTVSARPRAAAKKNGAADRLGAAERERDQLKVQLDEALAKITKLERARDEALGRIDWAIDSLHNVLERDA